ncbi:hypothetical protein BU17DRAFT_64406 [Hysterangium stoloniferum]|nr:hypothetical protein BU17DRAFT_64406 [Hysterangium stoloniferum]
MAKLGKIKVWMLVPEYSKICGLDFNERYGCVMKLDVIWNCISSGALKDQQYHNVMKVWNQQLEVFQEPRKETGIVNGQGVDRQGEGIQGGHPKDWLVYCFKHLEWDNKTVKLNLDGIVFRVWADMLQPVTKNTCQNSSDDQALAVVCGSTLIIECFMKYNSSQLDYIRQYLTLSDDYWNAWCAGRVM